MNKLAVVPFATALLFSSATFAGSATNNDILTDGTWTGWTQLTDDDGETSPGVGGQAFDTEYLFWRRSGTTLEIGLQTGFNLVDNKQTYGGDPYWGGDLQLIVNGTEYGVDSGQETATYVGDFVDTTTDTTGVDTAGVYSGVTWNNEVYHGHHAADPFAIDAGTLVAGALMNVVNGSGMANKDGGGTVLTYFRQYSIDVSNLTPAYSAGSDLTVYAHWTMSCGNDWIDGTFNSVGVPSELKVPSIQSLPHF